MSDLTPRQRQILSYIIEEYIRTGEPVGSGTLEKKYQIGVSPATIRNEMADLTQKGYLYQPHTSAGRVPSSQAFRLYVWDLMKEESLSVSDEVGVKEKVWDYKDELDRLFKQTTRVLSEKAQGIGFAYLDEGELYHSGYARILQSPEFFDIQVTRTLLSIIEEADQVRRLLAQAAEPDLPEEHQVKLVFGEEADIDYLDPVGIVFTPVKAGQKHQGYLGVIGPARLNYPRVIPFVRYVGNLLEEICK